MLCIRCGSRNCYTVDSRQHETIRRRRHCCSDCGARFITLETYAELLPTEKQLLNPKVQLMIKLLKDLCMEERK